MVMRCAVQHGLLALSARSCARNAGPYSLNTTPPRMVLWLALVLVSCGRPIVPRCGDQVALRVNEVGDMNRKFFAGALLWIKQPFGDREGYQFLFG